MGGFSNPIVAGNGSLVYPQIKSPGFNIANPAASPSPSWAILKNGLAYFFGVILSGGTITGPDYIINPAGAFFYSGTPAAGNLILSIATTAGTDGDGNAYPAGVAVGEPGGEQVVLQVLPSGVGELIFLTGDSTLDVHEAGITADASSGGSGTFSSMGIIGGEKTTHPDRVGIGLDSSDSVSSANMQFLYWDTSAGVHGYGYLDDTGMNIEAGSITAAQPGTSPAVPETWHVPAALGGGWTQASGLNIQYTLLTTGLVAIAGRLIASTVTAGTVIFTLPVGYRPLLGTISFQCRNVTTAGTVNFTVNTVGQVQIQSGMAATNVVDMDAIFPVSMTN